MTNSWIGEQGKDKMFHKRNELAVPKFFPHIPNTCMQRWEYCIPDTPKIDNRWTKKPVSDEWG